MNTDMNNATKHGLTKKIKASAKRVRSLLNMQIGDKLRRRTKDERHKFVMKALSKYTLGEWCDVGDILRSAKLI